jgi:hypothetical protein
MSAVNPQGSFRPVTPDSSIFTIFGEGAFKNGNPTKKHHASTPDKASEEHDLQNVLAPKH